jgi:hypothetical protein
MPPAVNETVLALAREAERAARRSWSIYDEMLDGYVSCLMLAIPEQAAVALNLVVWRFAQRLHVVVAIEFGRNAVAAFAERCGDQPDCGVVRELRAVSEPLLRRALRDALARLPPYWLGDQAAATCLEWVQNKTSFLNDDDKIVNLVGDYDQLEAAFDLLTLPPKSITLPDQLVT